MALSWLMLVTGYARSLLNVSHFNFFRFTVHTWRLGALDVNVGSKQIKQLMKLLAVTRSFIYY